MMPIATNSWPDATVDAHLRVESVTADHRDWAAVRRQIDRSGRPEQLMVMTDGYLSARQTVVAAFLDGRVVGHVCFRVEPSRVAGGRLVPVAVVDSRAVDAPFVGTSVEHVLGQVANARARTMSCPGLLGTAPARPTLRAA